MANETYWRSFKYAWGCYVVYCGQFQTPALLVDGFLSYLLACVAGNSRYAVCAYVGFALWILFTKTIKLIPHFWNYPSDLRFVPVSIAFSYLHGLINLYALCTLNTTTWGTQQLDLLEESRVGHGEVVPLLRSGLGKDDFFPKPLRGEFSYFFLDS